MKQTTYIIVFACMWQDSSCQIVSVNITSDPTCGLENGTGIWFANGTLELSNLTYFKPEVMLRAWPSRKNWTFILTDCESQHPSSAGNTVSCTNITDDNSITDDHKYRYSLFIEQTSDVGLSENNLTMFIRPIKNNRGAWIKHIGSLPFVYYSIVAEYELRGNGCYRRCRLPDNNPVYSSSRSSTNVTFCAKNLIDPYLEINNNEIGTSIIPGTYCVRQAIRLDACNVTLSYEERGRCNRTGSFVVRLAYPATFHFPSGITSTPTCGLVHGNSTWHAEGTLEVFNMKYFKPEVIMRSSPSETIWIFNLSDCLDEDPPSSGNVHFCTNITVDNQTCRYRLFIRQISDLALSEENITVSITPKDKDDKIRFKEIGTLPLIYDSSNCTYEVSGFSQRKLLKDQTVVISSSMTVTVTFCDLNLLEPHTLSIDDIPLSPSNHCVSKDFALKKRTTTSVVFSYTENVGCQRKDSFVVQLVVPDTANIPVWNYILAIGVPILIILVAFVVYKKRAKKSPQTSETSSTSTTSYTSYTTTYPTTTDRTKTTTTSGNSSEDITSVLPWFDRRRISSASSLPITMNTKSSVHK